MAWDKKNENNSTVVGATKLSELTDVAIPSPVDGYVLTFDNQSNQWLAKAIPVPTSNPTPDESVSDGITFSSILTNIENPFKKTKIKCLGDSITNGDGATGFVSGAYNGWNKMLNDWITAKYNGEEIVGLNHPNILVTSQYSIEGYGTHVMPYTYRINGPTDNGKGIEFTFYGEHFAIYYTGHNWGPIADVYVDGVKKGEMDTYSSSLTTQLSYEVTGLTSAYHTVKILETSRKNAAVTTANPGLVLEGIKIPKTKTVFNAGNNGITSSGIYGAMKGTDVRKNITSDDDIVLIMLGTNDRGTTAAHTGVLKWYQREIVKYALSLGCKVVLMSANPIPETGENKAFKMHDVDTAVKQVADELGVPFISNYDAFNQYCQNTGATLNSLLADGLHPNDTGYKVMANHIMRSIGITVKTDGITM